MWDSAADGITPTAVVVTLAMPSVLERKLEPLFRKSLMNVNRIPLVVL